MQRKTCLARPARPGKRDETHVVATEQCCEFLGLALAPDERSGLRRKVGWSLEALERCESIRQTLDIELKDPLGLLEILQPMFAEVADGNAVGQRALHEVARRASDQDLSAVTR